MPNTAVLIDMKAKSDFYKNNIKSENSFFQAVYNGDLAAVKAHLEADSSLFQKLTSKGDSVLGVAVLGKQQAVVEFLIKETPGPVGNCRPRFENPNDGTTALEIAAAIGHKANLKTLFNAQYYHHEKSYSDSRATTEAKYAIWYDHRDIVDIYSQEISDSYDNTKLTEILFLIIELNKVEMFKSIIADRQRREEGVGEILVNCLFRAIELNREDINDFIAYSISEIKKHPYPENFIHQTRSLLLPPNEDIGITYALSLLPFTAGKGNPFAFDILIKSGLFTLLEKSEDSPPVLILAILASNQAMVAHFIKLAAQNPQYQKLLLSNHGRETALTAAARIGDVTIFQNLYATKQFDLNTLYHRDTVLIIAMLSGNSRLVEYFLEQAKHDPNFAALLQRVDSYGDNALMEGVRSGIVEPFAALLNSKRFDVTTTNKKGQNVVDRALQQFNFSNSPGSSRSPIWPYLLTCAQTDATLKRLVINATSQLDPVKRKEILGNFDLEAGPKPEDAIRELAAAKKEIEALTKRNLELQEELLSKNLQLQRALASSAPREALAEDVAMSDPAPTTEVRKRPAA